MTHSFRLNQHQLIDFGGLNSYKNTDISTAL